MKLLLAAEEEVGRAREGEVEVTMDGKREEYRSRGVGGFLGVAINRERRSERERERGRRRDTKVRKESQHTFIPFISHIDPFVARSEIQPSRGASHESFHRRRQRDRFHCDPSPKERRSERVSFDCSSSSFSSISKQDSPREELAPFRI